KEILLSNNEKSVDLNLKNKSMEDSYDDIIKEASSKYNLPFELIKAVIKAESNFNPISISPKNAIGLMQLIPSTAKELGVDDPFDPYQNIMGGSRYLRMMLDKYNGNLFLALSAYNAGPGVVDKTNGIPNIEETKNYVDAVIKFYKEYSK
ncbi:MAG: lytic transglycosylase domain-containing protein, partial [Brevinematia bacterium]